MSIAHTPNKVNSLFDEEVWNEFVYRKFENEFFPKSYKHLDRPLSRNKLQQNLHSLLSKTDGVEKHPFLPFIKILLKTPRYKVDKRQNAKPKKYRLKNKIRPISYASHFDSAIYSFYAFRLNQLYTEYIKRHNFDHCVLAYRTDLMGKCNIQFAKEAFDLVKNSNYKYGCSAIAMDISGYFDSINHGTLKHKWCKVIGQDELPKDQYKVFKSLTAYSYINLKSFIEHFKINTNSKRYKDSYSLLDAFSSNDKFSDKFNQLRRARLITKNKPKQIGAAGIPQGSPMSSVLSNIYLLDFDELMSSLEKEMDFHYRRYCDDILIICDTIDVEEIQKRLIREIKYYDLIINKSKTELIQFKRDHNGKLRGFNKKKLDDATFSNTKHNTEKYFKNLQYLGFEYDGQKVLIRSSSLSRYFRKMKKRIRKSVSMAYSDSAKSNKIFRKKIYKRYSHSGDNNFVSYAYRASKKYYINKHDQKLEGLDSPAIRKQIRNHIRVLNEYLQVMNLKKYKFKLKKGRIKIGEKKL